MEEGWGHAKAFLGKKHIKLLNITIFNGQIHYQLASFNSKLLVYQRVKPWKAGGFFIL